MSTLLGRCRRASAKTRWATTGDPGSPSAPAGERGAGAVGVSEGDLTLASWPSQGFQLPVLLRKVLSDVPADRAGAGSGVMVTAQQSSLAVGVATPGTLFLAVSPGLGTGNALVVTLLVRLGVVGDGAAESAAAPGGRLRRGCSAVS